MTIQSRPAVPESGALAIQRGGDSSPLAYRVFWFLAALISIQPYSIHIGGSGVPANFFMAVFLVFSPWGYKFSRDGSVYLFVMLLSYFIGFIFISDMDPFFVLRQTLSLGAAALPVLLLFVRFRVPIDLVVDVLIVASILWAIQHLGHLIEHLHASRAVLSNPFLVKSIIGDRRWAFVAVIGMFLSLERCRRSAFYWIPVCLIGGTLALTFVRATYLSLIVGAIGYIASTWRLHPAGRQAMLTRLGIFILAFIVFINTNEVASAFYHKAADYLMSAIDAFFSGTLQPVANSSAYDRVGFWKEAFHFIFTTNPFTGSGMAGLYLINGNMSQGNTHNEYVDVLLRMGAIGLIVYLFMWFKLFATFVTRSPGMFAGLIGMFVFGFFHESTRLTQGSFVFFLLLSIISDPSFYRRPANLQIDGKNQAVVCVVDTTGARK